jgi:hypothetical protein
MTTMRTTCLIQMEPAVVLRARSYAVIYAIEGAHRKSPDDASLVQL